jgi:hypothetical protein
MRPRTPVPSPEATRMVAGGRTRSARPPDQMCGMEVRPRMGPRMGSRIKCQAAWIPSATAAAVGKSERVRVSGGLALRARPPATLRDAIRRRNRGFARASGVETVSLRVTIPRPSSLVPRPSSLVPRPSSLVPRPCFISLSHLLRTPGIATLPRFLGIFAIARLPESRAAVATQIKVKTEVRPNA